MDRVSNNGTDRGAFADSGDNQVGRMQQWFYVLAAGVAEVVETGDILGCARFVDDRFGPYTLLVETPRDRQSSSAVYAFIHDGHPIRIDAMLARPSLSTLP